MADTFSVVEIRKIDLHDVRQTDVARAPLDEGQVRLRIESFGITANNITYAVYGEAMSYWNFFPAPSGADFGVVPVWGFASVAESAVEGIEAGERVYGYLPMAEELVVEPKRVSPVSFADGAEHRMSLPGTYNNYVRCDSDPLYRPEQDDAKMLLQPLFFTSWLIDDFLADAGFFDAEQIIVTSASSKTGFGTAYMLAQRKGPKIVGLTSSGNVEFVQGLGCYDEAIAYDAMDTLADGPAILVDFAGSQEIVRAVHERYADDLKHSAVIGGTHWTADRSDQGRMPGPRQEFFFAPSRIEIRNADWGSTELRERLDADWQRFVPIAEQWLSVEHVDGLAAATEVYRSVLSGSASPSVAQVVQIPTS